MKKVALLMGILLIAGVFVGCSQSEEEISKVNIGYFPNISHAAAMVGVEKDIFKDEVKDYDIGTMNFPNGSLFMDALSTGQIDMGYVGPGPVLNRFLQGGEVVVIANASRGENVLVTRKDLQIQELKDLEGKIIATPSTGCTHDLLFRKMLEEENLAVEENGGTVRRIAQKPATMIGLFQQKQIDGAMVSEPWASLMEAEGVVNVVRDAKDVPWDGNLPAAVLVVRKDFLEKNPKVVEAFLNAHEKSIEYINEHKDETVEIVAKQIKAITNQEIDQNVIQNALQRVEYTSELDQSILQEFANLSKDLGFIKDDASLEGLFWNK